jgi:Flp pilus assembly pilin Flp
MLEVAITWYRLQRDRYVTKSDRAARAATMLEYVLIAGIVIGLAVGIFTVFGTSINNFFDRTNDAVDGSGKKTPLP